MENTVRAPHIREEGSFGRMVQNVFVALLPALIWGVYCFGWRVLLVLSVTAAAALAGENIICRFLLRTAPRRDGSTALSGVLLGALLPPAVSLPLAALGGILAAGVKLAFGGLGKNPVNPALTAGGLLYLVFSDGLTAYTAPFLDLPVFRAYFSHEEITRFAGDSAPLAMWKAGKMPTQNWYQLLSGDVPGALGAVSAMLLLAGGLYLLANRIVTFHAPLAFLATVGLTALLQPLEDGTPLEAVGVALLSGGTMLGAFFLLTDPVTAPVTRWGRACFGVIAGLFTALFRSVIGDVFAMVYAILLADLLARPLDFLFRPRPYGGRYFRHLAYLIPQRTAPEKKPEKHA
ncbi:MAG: RnfABCDGE type electron transport complex subunit D [Clostridia bacterium]|nr:RnfABCDGE type electron transport complex subunit D [Clostridia bacterium]